MAPKPTRPVPTPQELEILKVIWQRRQATVREVYLDLAQHRKIAYTTVLTMMGILEQKGHVTKAPGERANVYRPAEPRERVVRNLVNEFVTRVFSGSAKPLMVHLVDDSTLEPDELEEIETLLRQRRDKGKTDKASRSPQKRRRPGEPPQ